MVSRWPRALAARKSGTGSGRPSRRAAAPLSGGGLVLALMRPPRRAGGRGVPAPGRPPCPARGLPALIIDDHQSPENASRTDLAKLAFRAPGLDTFFIWRVRS